MIHIPSTSKRKILLIALALVLVSVTVLVAQNTPPKEAAPAETGQKVQVMTTPQTQPDVYQTYLGEEYLIVGYNDAEYKLLNPATGEKFTFKWTPQTRDREYKGNLGESVLVSERKYIEPNGTRKSFSTYKQTSPNGNTITSTLTEDPIVSVPGKGVFILKREKFLDRSYGEFDLKINPLGWVNDGHLLIAKGEPDAMLFGVFLFNVFTGLQTEILSSIYLNGDEYFQPYVEIPILSPSGRFLAYQKPVGHYDTHDGGTTELYIYDFQTGKHSKVGESNNIWPTWFTTKEVSQSPGSPGLFSSGPESSCPINISSCGAEGLTFKLPFAPGIAYKVSRDGECYTPSECSYSDGGYPTATWGLVNGVFHAGKKAIDFGDGAVGGTGDNSMPVIAAQSGEVVRVGWELPVGAGLGQRVWIKHADNTYTVYGHMKEGSFAVFEGDEVIQGQLLGIEGCTGSCQGQHIHFARSTTTNGAGQYSRWMTFDELGGGAVPQDERIYMSENGDYSIPSCSGLISLPACGGTFTGSTSGLLSNRSTYWNPNMPGAIGGNAASIYMTGPEKIYQISVPSAGNITVTLSNTIYTPTGSGYRLYPFLLVAESSCWTMDMLKQCRGTYSNGNQTVTFNAPSGGTYFIVIDGSAPNGVLNGASGTFTMTVTTPCSGPNCASATPIFKNVLVSGNNNGPASAVMQYGCIGWNENGPEKIFVYHHTGGNISMTLTQTSGADLDAFFLGSCDPNNCIAYVDQGTEPIPGPLPVGNYYIFVDGYNGAVGSFTLLISSQGGGGGTVPNDNCQGATTLSVNSACINTSGNNTNATASIPAPEGGCPTEGYKDLWYKFTMPNVLNPQVTIRSTAGSLTDLVMETYYSWSTACETMTYIVCEDDNTDGNGSLMPVINLQGGAGATVWVRVWGWGGQTGTFGICVLNYYSPNVGGDGGIFTIPSPTDERTGTATTLKSQSCSLQVMGMAITANTPPMSDYVLTNAIGQIIRQGKSENGNFSIDVSTNGIYFLSVVDPAGEKCVSKVFVH